MTHLYRSHRQKRSGIALVIVLAFVVLLSGLVVAYLLRSSGDQQSSDGSFNETKADQLATSALNIVVGDLKQEIVAGSTIFSTANGTTIYTPTQTSFILPARSGNPVGAPDPIPNLVRRSVRNDPIPAPGVASRASSINSATDVSRNGRFISTARWNKHYLIPRLAGASPSTTTPVAAFVAPDWVNVTSSGPNAAAAIGPGVLGRYAFAIYDEGGLIDVNVAGYPPPPNLTVGQFGPKGLICFADLTTTGLSVSAVNDLVGWRNYASTQPTGKFASFNFTTTSGTAYYNSVLGNTNGFLRTSGSVYNARTDQMFVSRQMLIEYRGATGFSADSLQNLGTFSREMNHSTWADSGTDLAARFPLSRFELFANTPPSNAAAVQQYFGLVYVPPSGPTPEHPSGPIAEHWRYCGASGSSLLSSIPSISGTNQNPDLFPLLQYALPNGTPIVEILSIGASLIDQRDPNDDTTWIEFADSDPTLPPHKAFGVDRAASTEPEAPARPNTLVVLNGTGSSRPFRNVGELGYAYRNGSTSLDFYTAASTDAPLLDLFTFSTAPTRAGIMSLNSRNASALAAAIQGAITNESSLAYVGQNDPKTNASNSAAAAIISDGLNGTGVRAAASRRDVARLAAAAGTIIGSTEEARETVARALAEVGQTRTWNLFIDVIAQSGRYPPIPKNPSDFVVEGEKRYWLHIAIDRLNGRVIDQQLEAVYE
jgi:hypothetical protein